MYNAFIIIIIIIIIIINIIIQYYLKMDVNITMQVRAPPYKSL